jgi:hypothetical protein
MGKPSRKYQNKKHGRKTQRKYKKKGGNIRKEKITLLFEKQHTSPNISSTIRVYTKPTIPTSIIDFGALSQLTNFYMEKVEEKLATLKYGNIGPPQVMDTVDLYFNDKDIPIFNYPEKKIQHCNKPQKSEEKIAEEMLNKDDEKDSQEDSEDTTEESISPEIKVSTQTSENLPVKKKAITKNKK